MSAWDMHSPGGTASFRLLRQVVCVRTSKTMVLVVPTEIAGRLENKSRRDIGDQQLNARVRADGLTCAFIAARRHS
jgi:hypothetical protein